VLNFFFKSKEPIKEQASLVFIVTPTSYDPTSRSANDRASEVGSAPPPRSIAITTGSTPKTRARPTSRT
jgi:Flp pilus assembly secretin CpaC